MANSADPDQLASSEANWSGSTLFAKAGCIQAQHGKVNTVAQDKDELCWWVGFGIFLVSSLKHVLLEFIRTASLRQCQWVPIHNIL